MLLSCEWAFAENQLMIQNNRPFFIRFIVLFFLVLFICLGYVFSFLELEEEDKEMW